LPYIREKADEILCAEVENAPTREVQRTILERDKKNKMYLPLISKTDAVDPKGPNLSFGCFEKLQFDSMVSHPLTQKDDYYWFPEDDDRFGAPGVFTRQFNAFSEILSSPSLTNPNPFYALCRQPLCEEHAKEMRGKVTDIIKNYNMFLNSPSSIPKFKPPTVKNADSNRRSKFLGNVLDLCTESTNVYQDEDCEVREITVL
jgi:hypothetical protein